MSAPFVGEIRMFGCNFPPRTWAFCNGQIISIAQNTALFSLLGTYYGGNGTQNFALPDLQGRAPMCFGQGPALTQRDLGENGGTEGVALLVTEMPAHNHAAIAETSRADRANASSAMLASGKEPVYVAGTANAALSPLATSVAGGSVPHNNLQPYLALNFCIALQGIYPMRQ